MATPIRIILITGDGLGHRYVANRLAAEVQLVGIIVDHGKKIGRANRAQQLIRRYTAGQLISRTIKSLSSRILRDAHTSRQAMLSVFGTASCSTFSHPEILHHVYGINTLESVEVVSALQPDVILVFGTGIVGQKVLSLARTIALNMHTGISPYYRGCDCYFWPLYNRELNKLGATVHECVREVDG